MESLGKLSGMEEMDLDSMRRVFDELIDGIEAKQKAQELDNIQKDIKSSFEKWREETERRKEEAGSILKEVLVREDELNEREELISDYLDKVKDARTELIEKKRKWVGEMEERKKKLDILAKEIEHTKEILELKENQLPMREKEHRVGVSSCKKSTKPNSGRRSQGDVLLRRCPSLKLGVKKKQLDLCYARTKMMLD
ncbi:OLC1v1000657C1 [Oldenlandia corymbosa var. corymbosa]|uniref:OLC1v1000657C1 n=1 Tax=Oldenlandia corymbosa var. corymbosa TaxID=529605 RepID=A0AAV1D3S4_OLDCO|nr:OLC1v1000657C1 [Oldenlandia corymbosa var. corymbosa]